MAESGGKVPRSPGLQALHDRYIGADPERVAAYAREVLRMEAGIEDDEDAEDVAAANAALAEPGTVTLEIGKQGKPTTIVCHGCGRKIDPVVSETGRVKYPTHQNYMKTAECPASGYEPSGESAGTRPMLPVGLGIEAALVSAWLGSRRRRP